MSRLSELQELYGIPMDVTYNWTWRHNVEQLCKAVVQEAIDVAYKNGDVILYLKENFE